MIIGYQVWPARLQDHHQPSHLNQPSLHQLSLSHNHLLSLNQPTLRGLHNQPRLTSFHNHPSLHQPKLRSLATRRLRSLNQPSLTHQPRMRSQTCLSKKHPGAKPQLIGSRSLLHGLISLLVQG